jgi:hypothetical protein
MSHAIREDRRSGAQEGRSPEELSAREFLGRPDCILGKKKLSGVSYQPHHPEQLSQL